MRTTTLVVAGHLAALAIASIAGASGPPIASSFSTGAEGWSIVDLNCSNYAQVIGGGTITWFAIGGDPGGFVRATDPSSNCYAYESPAAFEGDRGGYIGGALRWRIRTNVADWLPGSVLIMLGGGMVLVADVPQPTIGAWLSYEVPLNPSSFRLNNASGPAVTVAQFNAAMTNLTSIRISAEFGSEAGEETVDLDSVVLVTSCPADIDGDGDVDASDLALVLGAWGSTTDLAADLDATGAVDASDLAVLLGAWGPCN